MLIELAVTAGPHVGRTFQFREHATFLVGRSSRLHFALPDKDPYVSRTHFLVEVNPPLCRLKDMGSRNGTLVNGIKTPEADLKHGDSIGIGTTTMSVRLIESKDDSSPGTLGLPAAPPLTGSTPQSPMTTVTLDAPSARTKNADIPTIPGCEIHELIGQGGMGSVYRGLHLKTGAVIAVKTIRPAVSLVASIVSKFLREADIVRRLDHPGIIQFRDSGTANGLVWFAMEYVDGADAQRMSTSQGPLDIKRAVNWTL